MNSISQRLDTNNRFHTLAQERGRPVGPGGRLPAGALSSVREFAASKRRPSIMKLILAAIDFTAVTPRVVAESAALARTLHGRVILMHVNQPSLVVPGRHALVCEIAAANVMGEAAVSTELSALEHGLHGKCVRACSIQVNGAPSKMVIKEAEKLGADYIVIGSHGHAVTRDLVLGSTARGIVKRAQCPVIVIPAAGMGSLVGRPDMRLAALR